MKWYWIALIVLVSIAVGYGIATMMKPSGKKNGATNDGSAFTGTGAGSYIGSNTGTQTT